VVAGLHQQRVVADVKEYLKTPAHDKSLEIYNEYDDIAQLKAGLRPGQWLLTEDRFQDWASRKIPLLWVAGGPGAGKSVLSAVAISKLKDLTHNTRDDNRNSRSVAYFYIQQRHTYLQNLGNILKSLAYQLTQSDPTYLKFATAALRRPDTSTTPTKLWKNLFVDYFGPLSANSAIAHVVLDGLDEAPKEALEALFDLLQDVSHESGELSRISFALFGRREIAEYFPPKFQRSIQRIDINRKNESDISIFVAKQLGRNLVVRTKMKLFNNKAAGQVALEIHNRVMAKADGLFFKVVF
jgi:hypothetical protein